MALIQANLSSMLSFFGTLSPFRGYQILPVSKTPISLQRRVSAVREPASCGHRCNYFAEKARMRWRGAVADGGSTADLPLFALADWPAAPVPNFAPACYRSVVVRLSKHAGAGMGEDGLRDQRDQRLRRALSGQERWATRSFSGRGLSRGYRGSSYIPVQRDFIFTLFPLLSPSLSPFAVSLLWHHSLL